MRLRDLFDDLPDLAELVLGAPAEDPLMASWLEAEADARAAYDHWRLDSERDSYVAYRACADRADAAQDALALRAPLSHCSKRSHGQGSLLP